MNRNKLESALKESMIYDTTFEAYRGVDIDGNDILIHFDGNDCYICITDDVNNDCRGYSTDIDYNAVELTDDSVVFHDEGITVTLKETYYEVNLYDRHGNEIFDTPEFFTTYDEARDYARRNVSYQTPKALIEKQFVTILTRDYDFGETTYVKYHPRNVK